MFDGLVICKLLKKCNFEKTQKHKVERAIVNLAYFVGRGYSIYSLFDSSLPETLFSTKNKRYL